MKLLHVGPQVDEFYSYVNNNPNMTWFGLVWCTTEWPVAEGIALPCRYAHEQGTSLHTKRGEKKMILYSVFYNYTMEDSAFFKML